MQSYQIAQILPYETIRSFLSKMQNVKNNTLTYRQAVKFSRNWCDVICPPGYYERLSFEQVEVLGFLYRAVHTGRPIEILTDIPNVLEGKGCRLARIAHMGGL